MPKPIWMTDGDWQKMRELKGEWDRLVRRHKELRGKVRTSEENAEMREINLRLPVLNREAKEINEKNPILPHNIVPQLRLERAWDRFWELRDGLATGELSAEDRFKHLVDAVSTGELLVREGHDRRAEIEPYLEHFMQEMIYGVHLVNNDTELILEVSNSFGDQIVRPVSQQKRDADFKGRFLRSISELRPDRSAVFSFEKRMTTTWNEVVQWITEKLG